MAEETREEIERKWDEVIKNTKRYFGSCALVTGLMGFGALYSALREPTWDPAVVERYEDIKNIRDNLGVPVAYSMERLSRRLEGYSPKEEWSEDRRRAVYLVSEFRPRLEEVCEPLSCEKSRLDGELKDLLEENPGIEECLSRRIDDGSNLFGGGCLSLIALMAAGFAIGISSNYSRGKKEALERFDRENYGRRN